MLDACCRVKKMHEHINPKNNQPAPLIAKDVFQIIMEVHFGSCKVFRELGVVSADGVKGSACRTLTGWIAG